MSEQARPQLTPARWAILALVARGASNAEIAAALGLTNIAVKNQLIQIYRRLPLGDGGNPRVLAALWYLREGYTDRVEAGGVPADAARRAVIDAERARTPRHADTGPDAGNTGEMWVEEG